jgi:hypothetical protein
LRTSLLTGIGALLALVGVVWTLQGLGYVGGSVMSGETLWAVVGPIVALVGIALIAASVRAGRAGPRR